MIHENEEAGVLGSNYIRPIKSMIIEHPRSCSSSGHDRSLNQNVELSFTRRTES